MLERLTRVPVDTFLLALLAVVATDAVFPATGTAADVLDVATKIAVGLLFLLYGARLSPMEALHGLRHWRLHLLVLAPLLVVLLMQSTVGLSRLARLNRADTTVVLFCGSKKSLASGLPMALVFFGTGAVGLIMLPLILFHQIQLFVCAVIASRMSRTVPVN